MLTVSFAQLATARINSVHENVSHQSTLAQTNVPHEKTITRTHVLTGYIAPCVFTAVCSHEEARRC